MSTSIPITLNEHKGLNITTRIPGGEQLLIKPKFCGIDQAMIQSYLPSMNGDHALFPASLPHSLTRPLPATSKQTSKMGNSYKVKLVGRWILAGKECRGHHYLATSSADNDPFIH